MTKVNKNSKCSQRQNWMAVSIQRCKLKVDTNKHVDLNLVGLQITEQRINIPSDYKEITKAQNKDQELRIY
jgi:hypothetical protein